MNFLVMLSLDYKEEIDLAIFLKELTKLINSQTRYFKFRVEHKLWGAVCE